METVIKMMTAKYRNIRLPETDARMLRGFFANLDTMDSYLHNHAEDGADIYRYPRIQYKILRGMPVIVAFGEGISSIYPHLLEQTKLQIGNTVYSDTELDIRLSEQTLGIREKMQSYYFATPWLALNQANYWNYMEADEEGRERLLSRILIGNLLALYKAFGVTVGETLTVEHQFQRKTVIFKGKKMEGFSAIRNFSVKQGTDDPKVMPSSCYF